METKQCDDKKSLIAVLFTVVRQGIRNVIVKQKLLKLISKPMEKASDLIDMQKPSESLLILLISDQEISSKYSEMNTNI